ncbi:hypothetical protein [Thalassospira lucentensis]|uniref:hypothetical protein n=1 Tax=Thalassospira lucentensis TaxID=168935 RepID=UPI0003B5E23B|nr:hypothetical protein [Thalassospira lucentensis]RCK22577.1 hypothetical protein TH1_16950 [Thalassospira lucentensis MCCC 1A00383 = DSM 14000]
MSKQVMLMGLVFAISSGLGATAYADESPNADAEASLNDAGKADPVSSNQLYFEMRIQGGQYAQNYRHQMLTGDFTCDDVVDRIAGWVDLDSPEGPRFAMLFVTNHGGKDQSEIRYLPFESSEQVALCIHDETAPPVMSWQENSTEFMAEVIGDDRLCNFAIRVDDFMCDAPQFFYSKEPAGNGNHWLFFRN